MRNRENSIFTTISPAQFAGFIFFPLATLLLSLKNLQSNQTKTIFFLFCVYAGYVFVIQEGVIGTADSARYAAQLEIYYNQSTSIQNILGMVYDPQYNYVDYYQPLVTFFVSRVTNNTHVLFAIFALVFGYFYTQNLWIIFYNAKIINVYTAFFIALLIFILPIWQINGVRMWTASHVFIYGLLILLVKNKKVGYLWSALSVLVHFSFLIPVLLLLIYKFAPKNFTFLILIFFITAVIQEINLSFVRNILSYLPSTFETRFQGYTHEVYAESRVELSQRKSLFFLLSSNIGSYFYYAWIFILYYFRNQIFFAKDFKEKLFKFVLYFGSFSNLASLVPSGGRFEVITSFLIVSLLLVVFTQPENYFRFQKHIKFSILPIILMVLLSIRIILEYMGIMTLVGNPIAALIYEDKVSIIVFLKDIFQN